jgi:bifunctional DNA-binding transcriptional regulator/antitoxin component of YhaV-PrlF toxin-antitoxin module
VEVFNRGRIFETAIIGASILWSRKETVPKAHIRNGELTIPLSDEIREKLGLKEGDELEAHVFPGSVVFRAASPDARERAWERICAITEQVRLRPGQPEMSIDEVEQMIVDEVKAVRRARRRPPHD